MRNLGKLKEQWDLDHEFTELSNTQDSPPSDFHHLSSKRCNPSRVLKQVIIDFQHDQFWLVKLACNEVIDMLEPNKNRSSEENDLLYKAYFYRGCSILNMLECNESLVQNQTMLTKMHQQYYKELNAAENDFKQLYSNNAPGDKDFLEGFYQLRKGDKQVAEKKFNAAIEKESRYSADCQSELGQLELMRDQFGRAIYCFTEAVRLSPSNPVYYKHRAFAHYYNKEWLKALADCIDAQKLGGSPVFGPLNWCFNALKSQFLKGFAEQDKLSQRILVECLNNPIISQIFWKEMGQVTRKQIFNIVEIIPTGPDKDRLLKACLEQRLEIGNLYWYSGSPNKDDIFLLIKAINNPDEQKLYYHKALDHNPQVPENQQDILYRLCNTERKIIGKGTTHTMWHQRSELCKYNVSEEQLSESEENSWEMPFQ